MVYLPTELGDFVRANVSKYSIHGASGIRILMVGIRSVVDAGLFPNGTTMYNMIRDITDVIQGFVVANG